LEAYLEKNNRYSTWAAYDRLNQVQEVNFYHLTVKPWAAFMKRYFVQLGFLDGKQGFIISMFGAWGVFMRYVKIWRMKKGEKLKR
jgi:hypothetical protein